METTSNIWIACRKARFYLIGSVPEIWFLENIILSPTDVSQEPLILVQFSHPRVPGCSWSPCFPLGGKSDRVPAPFLVGFLLIHVSRFHIIAAVLSADCCNSLGRWTSRSLLPLVSFLLLLRMRDMHAVCLCLVGLHWAMWPAEMKRRRLIKWQKICARGGCCPYAGHARAKVSGEDRGAGPLGRYRDAGPRSFRPRGTRPLEECLEGCFSRCKVIPAVQYGFFWCTAVRSGHSWDGMESRGGRAAHSRRSCSDVVPRPIIGTMMRWSGRWSVLDSVPAEASVDQLCATLREHPLVEALWQEFVAFSRDCRNISIWLAGP